MRDDLSIDIEKLSTQSSSYPKTLMEMTGKSYPFLAICFAVALYAIVFLVELLVPWRKDIQFPTQPMSFTSRAWSPVLAGVIIGLLQLPLNGLFGRMIGTSMSYVTLLSQVYQGHVELQANKNNWWQVFMVVGSIVGSYISSFLTMGSFNVFDPAVQGASPLLAFVGGILLLLGAKTMRACTSGHGLSGMALLCIPSIVATCCIFAGGIATGVLVNRFL